MEKIKTIGDCYMAACGLPVFRPDHAVRHASSLCAKGAFSLSIVQAEINREREWGGEGGGVRGRVRRVRV